MEVFWIVGRSRRGVDTVTALLLMLFGSYSGCAGRWLVFMLIDSMQ